MTPRQFAHSYNAGMEKHWKTRLIHSDARIPEGFRSLNVPVYRASTVVFPNAAAADDNWDQYESGYTYGLYGTPTTLELAARICELEARLPHHHHARRAKRNLAHQPGIPEGRRPHPGARERLRAEPQVLQSTCCESSAWRSAITSRPSAAASKRCSSRTRVSCGARAQARSPWRCRTCQRSPLPRMRAVRLVVLDNTWSAGVSL